MANRSAKRTGARISTPTRSNPEPKASRPFAPGYGIAAAKGGKELLPWAWIAKKEEDGILPHLLVRHHSRKRQL
jgi:hypothetical protein